MWAALGNILAGLAGSLLGRVLVGAGLGIATFAVIGTMTNSLMEILAQNLSGVSADLAQLLRISGVAAGLSMVGSAFLTRAAMVSAMIAVKKVSA